MNSSIRLWQRAPFIRLLAALAIGIAVEERFELPLVWMVAGMCVCGSMMAVYFLLPVKMLYRWAMVNGAAVHLLFFCCGALLLWKQDVRQRENWVGKMEASSYYVVRLEEAPVRKARSWKALARMEFGGSGKELRQAEGEALLYFSTDAGVERLPTGSRLAFGKSLQPVMDNGNPGGFNYRRYCLFGGITHQAYLKRKEFIVIDSSGSGFSSFMEAARQRVVVLLRSHINGAREQGLAEALLIGYKNDLDQQLVQAYTRTGVVHIIAISGMHLALIYGLLAGLTKPLARGRWRWLRLTLILCGLWGFSLLAGAGASVVRSTVMFSCIALGQVLERKIPVYNSLAFSAFALLCYDPFWLWDVGFQLSYLAVLSIVVFYTPVYRQFSWTNPLLDAVWKSMAVSLAAQVLTTPLSLYHFHQFPLLFLLTNLVAVPLSSLVLMGEIAICTLGWIPLLARLLGHLTTVLMQFLNSYIERLDRVSFAIWEGFSISEVQLALLLIATAALYYWLMEKRKTGLVWALSALLGFTLLRTWSFFGAARQQKLIVYSIPHHSLLHLVRGRDCCLVSDSSGYEEGVRRFYLQPALTLMRLREQQRLEMTTQTLCFCNKTILLLRGKPPPPAPQTIDLLIVSGRMKEDPADWLGQCRIGRIVLDPSVPAYVAARWKNAAAQERIDCYDVAQKGAFVVNL